MSRGFLLFLSLAWASNAWAQAVPPGAKVTVVAVTQPSPTLPQFTMVDVPLLRTAAAQKSGGRVEFRVQSWPELNVQGPDVIRLVRSGQVEIGAATLGVVSGDAPILDAVDLAGLNPQIAQAKTVALAMLPSMNKDLERLGVKLVAVYPFAAQVFFCRKPVASLADLKGLKIRTNGPSVIDFVSAFGAQGAALAFPEVYGALERGAVDCAITGTGTGNSVKWWEVAGHMYSLPSTWSVAGYFVNLAWWNKLDPAVRGFIETTMAELQDAQWALGEAATADGIACNVGKAEGCKIHTLVTTRPMTNVTPAADEMGRIKTVFAEKVLPNWVKRCGARCGEVFNAVIAPIAGVSYTAP